ncbi:MAG: phosphotransferase [Oligoflexales bacterium]
MPGSETLTNSTLNLNKHQAYLPSIITEIRQSVCLDRQHISKIAGDGSGRQFYRLSHTLPSQVLMVLPEEEKEQLKLKEHTWVTLCESFRQSGIRTPKIHSVLHDSACLLVEDCGDTTLSKQLEENPTDFRSLYHQASLLCSRINQTSTPTPNQDFSSETFYNELLFFHSHAKITIPLQSFKEDAQRLCHDIMQSPQVITHRDFHSRNIMVTSQNEWILIDFQDARMGPAAYDLVSLCFDPYVSKNFDERVQLLEENCLHFEHSKEILNSWRPVAIQRLMKALGSFYYLTQLKRGDYTPYIPVSCEILKHLDMSPWPFLEAAVKEADHA